MAIETGTVQFEKYNGGNAYRTAFFTFTVAGVTEDDTDIDSGTTLIHSKMYAKEPDITSGTINIRSCEIYVDITDLDNGEADKSIIVSRLAKLADENTLDEDLDNYDFRAIITDILPKPIPNTDNIQKYTIDPSSKKFSTSTSSINFKDNQLSNLEAIRVVFVCDVE